MNLANDIGSVLKFMLTKADHLVASGRLEDAAAIYEHACTLLPAEPNLHHVLGLVRLTQGAMAKAIQAYEKATAIDPNQAQWWSNLGVACMKSDDLTKAASCFQHAHKIEPQNASHFVCLGAALRIQGDLKGTIESLQQALDIAPGDVEAMVNLQIVFQQTCQWQRLASILPGVDQATHLALDTATVPKEHPLLNIRRTADLSLNLAVARSWSGQAEQRALRAATPFTHRPGRQPGRRITVGYLSYDFRDHPVAHQMLPLFGLHDRNRFKVLAFSFGPDDNSMYRRGLQNDCDQFIDIRSAGIAQAAQFIYDQHVDILIDLMGHTHHNRMEILALRPAPIQVGYLGFLSSSGADFIDYLIADPVVVPETHNCYYREKLIRMPYCYQINHQNMSAKKAPPARRKDWGLPEGCFVFCCFNRAYKIDPHIFESWMRILSRVPESVLWLYHDNPMAVDQLRSAARRSGIEPSRLIFADKLALPEHLKRVQLADLALDTTTYNGGATTSNALLAGVPVLAMLGDHWVSRMTASHLLAAGLPELVVDDLHAYEHKAVALAHWPRQLQTLRTKLKQNIAASALFDAQGFVHDLEKAFSYIRQRYLKGQLPDHTRVSELP